MRVTLWITTAIHLDAPIRKPDTAPAHRDWPLTEFTLLWMSGVLAYFVALGKPNASTAFAIHSLE